MLLSFIESQIPPLVAVPGVKIGLSNIVTVFLLYTLGIRSAATVSFIRVCLSSLLVYASFKKCKCRVMLIRRCANGGLVYENTACKESSVLVGFLSPISIESEHLKFCLSKIKDTI